MGGRRSVLHRLKAKWLLAHSKRRRSLVYRGGVGSLELANYPLVD